jgi:hypothetical protein
MAIEIDRNLMREAVRQQNDGCGETGWRNTMTGEILFVHEDADRFED